MEVSRPPAAEDYVEILNLYAYYNLTSDSGDAESYASCWAEDGALTISPMNFEVRGRSEFLRFKLRDKERRDGSQRFHWNSGIVLEKIDESTVRGRCYLHALNAPPGSLPELADAGIYDDTVVKEQGRWRFARRRLTLTGSSWTPPSR